MAFQVKNFVSIVAGMLNYMRSTQTQITDFNVGSVARTLVESPAVEIDELYQQMFIGLREAIPVSVYNSFSFDPLPAEAASGVIRFTCLVAPVANILIPAGTTVSAPSGAYTYSSLVDATLLAGNTYVDVMVYCNTTGSATNVTANTLTQMVSAPIAGISSVTNQLAFTTGADLELDAARKIRFKGFIATLQRGTSKAIKYGAMTANLKSTLGLVIEEAQFANVVEPYLTNISLPIGLVNCYIHNGVSSTSSGLVAAAQQIINGYYDSTGTPVPGWKAAGVVVVVIAATDVPVNVSATLTISPYADPVATRAAATVVVSTYLQSIDIGIAVNQSELIAQLMGVAGVTKVILTAPTGDVTALPSQKIIPGTITLS